MDAKCRNCNHSVRVEINPEWKVGTEFQQQCPNCKWMLVMRLIRQGVFVVLKSIPIGFISE